jgi:uncharacterized membrane protein
MYDKFVLVATWLAVGSGALSAGVFFDWSVFIVPGLNRLPPSQAVTSFQELNRYAPGPFFGLALTAASILSVLLGVAAVTRWDEPGSQFLLIGGVLFIVGGPLITALANIPLNNRLDGYDPNAIDIATKWADFRDSWLLWNHLRTLLTSAGTLSFIAALFRLATD